MTIMFRYTIFILSLVCLVNQKTFAFDNTYDHIDKHATQSPKSVEKSISELAQYLTAPCKNQREKVRAIFCWIAHNVDYNIKAFEKKQQIDSSPEAVLKNRNTVCDGYSQLFQALANQAGLESVKITGYSKGYNYQPGTIFTGHGNHSWNAVKLDNKWYLLDVTWGAGYLNENSKFIKQYNDYYFLSPPEEFIYNHFPDKQQWQLLKNPISKNEFEQRAYLKPAFFRYGLKLISHENGIIRADKKITIKIHAQKNIQLVARLYQEQHELDERLTFIQRSTDTMIISAVFPEKSSYILRIFGKKNSISGEYQWALDYKIETSGGAKGKIGFPRKFGTFIESNAYLYQPLDKYLKSGRETFFKIRVPEADEVAMIIKEKFIPLVKSGDLFTGRIKIQKEEIVIAVKFPGRKVYNWLLQYEGY